MDIEKIDNIEEVLDNEIKFLSIDQDGKRKNITKSKRENLTKILTQTKSQLNILQNEIETLSKSDNSHIYEDKINEQNEIIEQLIQKNKNLEKELKDKENTINELLSRNKKFEKTYKKINDLIIALDTE
jgi:TolA-binding protein